MAKTLKTTLLGAIMLAGAWHVGIIPIREGQALGQRTAVIYIRAIAAEKKPTFQSLYEKAIAEVDSKSFSQEYVRANMKQIFADTFDAAETRALSRCRHVLARAVNDYKIRQKERAEDRAFLVTVRATGLKDKDIQKRMQRLVLDTDWIGDPNAFLPL